MSMNQSQTHPKGNVPFSWENRPGVSKVTNQRYPSERNYVVKLPPPPCPIESPRISGHDIRIPLPPCTFQTPARSSSTKGLKKHDDPFLAAYKECTKTTRKDKLSKNHAAGSAGLLRKGMFQFNFSCKQSCSVRDDNLVRISQLPYECDGERDEKYWRRL